jgi:mannitol/fructose-specific phosphotransferase system IIA component (Ntr-type)/DNA-directed RNA polymerase subunit RPC12/RpoP
MKQIINQLIQLQDLNFTLEEQKALTSDTHLKDLEKSIKSLSKDLPQDIYKLFHDLLNHYSIAVVPMAKDICTGCGMTVPTISAYEVKVGEKLIQCPRCSRILYYRDTLPRQLKRIKAQGTKPSAGIARFSSSKLMIPQLNAKTRDEALEEMINLMADEGFVEKQETLLEAAISRESIVPTAIEHGLAFPHVRGVEGGGLFFALGLQKQGIRFGAPKNKFTKIIFFIVIPLAASAFYLQLITGLMETFRDAKSRNKLLECKTPERMWAVLNQLTKKTIQ